MNYYFFFDIKRGYNIMKITISQENSSPISITIPDNKNKSIESLGSLTNEDVEKYFKSIQKQYNLIIPNQVKTILKQYNNELIHCYGHDVNCIPLNLNTDRCRLLFEEATEEFNRKYYDSGILPSACKDFVNIESMGNGDSLLVYKNNELYFYSHDTNNPLTKVKIYKDFNDYFNKILKPSFNKDGPDSNLYSKSARIIDNICKKYLK
jgi:hypothetical protein